MYNYYDSCDSGSESKIKRVAATLIAILVVAAIVFATATLAGNALRKESIRLFVEPDREAFADTPFLKGLRNYEASDALSAAACMLRFIKTVAAIAASTVFLALLAFVVFSEPEKGVLKASFTIVALGVIGIVLTLFLGDIIAGLEQALAAYNHTLPFLDTAKVATKAIILAALVVTIVLTLLTATARVVVKKILRPRSLKEPRLPRRRRRTQ